MPKHRRVARFFLIGLALGLLTCALGSASGNQEAAGVETAAGDNSSRTECVILVHGLGRRKRSMRKIEEALRAGSFNVVNWDYLSTMQTVADSAQSLYECYALNERYNERVHFVTHSLGGIVVRCMLKNHDAAKLGKIVMIAPPNQGSALARLLLDGPFDWFPLEVGHELKSQEHLNAICATPDTDVLIVAGTKSFDLKNPASWLTRGRLEVPNDGTVSVAETKLAGVNKYLYVEDSHTGLLGNPTVVEAVVYFLTEKECAGEKGQPDPDEAALFEKGLRILSRDPNRINEILSNMPRMPNVKTATIGGTVWWADLVEVDGWRVQKNILFGNCRLLDPGNVRRAWGGEEAMIKAFDALVEKYGNTN